MCDLAILVVVDWRGLHPMSRVIRSTHFLTIPGPAECAKRLNTARPLRAQSRVRFCLSSLIALLRRLKSPERGLAHSAGPPRTSIFARDYERGHFFVLAAFVSSRSLLGSILNSQTDHPTLKNVAFTMRILTFLKNQCFRSKDGFETVWGLSRAPFGSSWGALGGLLGALWGL